MVAAIVTTLALRELKGPRWSDDQSLARIQQLIDSGRPSDAFELACTAPSSDRVPDRLWDAMSTTVTLHTDPPGANVSMRARSTHHDTMTRVPF